MKKERILYLIIFALFFNFCSNEIEQIAVNEIDFNSFKIEKKGIADFMASGKIKKIVRLEVNEDSLIGNIDLVRIDKNGGILVGDFYSSKKILRFDNDGKFIQSYGKVGRGPGEHLGLKSFDILSDGSVILLTDLKLIRIAENGQLIKEIRTNFVPMDIAVIDDLIYISHLGFRMSPKADEAVLIFNTDLEKVGGFIRFDNRLEKYKYIPLNSFAKSNNKLFFIDYYSFKLYEYIPRSSKLNCLKISSDNSALDVIWGKKNLTEKDFGVIKKKLQRFNYIYGFREGLLLYDYCEEKRIFDHWVLNLNTNIVVTFKFSAEYFKDNLFFSRIEGAYDGGIIGVFSDSERFNKFKNNYPLLKDIEYSLEDNPILAFFEFDIL